MGERASDRRGTASPGTVRRPATSTTGAGGHGLPPAVASLQRHAGNRVTGAVLDGRIRRKKDKEPAISGPLPGSESMKSMDYQNLPSGPDVKVWTDAIKHIDDGASEQAKLDALVAVFRANPMNFQYVGASRNWSLKGDCGSLARTFVEIADKYFDVKGVATKFNNGPWVVTGDVHEIDRSRHPNMEGGGYYFHSSHVWCDWKGQIYDVLFGVKGQNGQKPQQVEKIDGVTHFKHADQWYRAEGTTNRYVKCPEPKTTAPKPSAPTTI